MLRSPMVLPVAALAAFTLSQGASAAPPPKKLHHAPATVTPDRAAAPRGTDLNSPSTDFSTVTPVIEDPKAELLKPRKKRDPTFD